MFEINGVSQQGERRINLPKLLPSNYAKPPEGSNIIRILPKISEKDWRFLQTAFLVTSRTLWPPNEVYRPTRENIDSLKQTPRAERHSNKFTATDVSRHWT
jgi:hypothetical protein